MNATLRLLLVSLAAACGFAHAQGQPVGRVLLAAGDTTAVRNGQTVRLQYNSPVEFKDILRTGPASSLQVRFVDEGLISLRDNSEFAIEDYRFAGGTPADDSERAFFRLIKGGFRSVTGLIGRARNQNYRVQTQTATIGIRGTDYGVRLCAGDCGSGVKDGLYGTVHGQSGGTNQITVSNEGTPAPTTFGINQHFYVADAKTAPQPLLVPPSFVSIRPQGKAQAAQQGGSGNGGEQSSDSSGAKAESRPSSPEAVVATVSTPVLPFRVVETLNSAGTPTVLPPANGFGVFYPISGSFEGLFDDDNSTATYNGQNQLLGYQVTNGANGSLTGSIVDPGSVTASNGQVFTWGRWTGGTVTTRTGSVIQNVPLLFITASGLQPNNIQSSSIGGQGTYTFLGGPKAVDAGGNAGTVTNSALSINFTAATASYAIDINFASVGTFGPAILSLSGTGSHNNGQNNGEFQGNLSGTCSGGGCLLSSVSGKFDVGLAGPNGYDFAVVGGGVNNGTRGGGVVFLTAHEVASFTPGPPPTFPTGQIAFSNNSPSFTNTFTVSSGGGSNNATFSGFTPTSFSCCSGFSGTFGGSLAAGESGSASLVDGSTINWGRWTGAGTVVTSPPNPSLSPASGVTFVTGSQGFTSVPTSGSFTYSFAGGPNPTSNAGTVGSWTSGGAFNITFGANNVVSVASPLSMSVGGTSFSLTTCSGGCTISGGQPVFGNMNLTGTCTAGTGGCAPSAGISSSVAGTLVGPQAGGFAVAGSLSSPAGTVTFGGAYKR